MTRLLLALLAASTLACDTVSPVSPSPVPVSSPARVQPWIYFPEPIDIWIPPKPWYLCRTEPDGTQFCVDVTPEDIPQVWEEIPIK